MADNRTGPAVQKLVESIQEDASEVVDLLQRGLDKLRVLEGQTKGINGLSNTLKAKGNEIGLAIDVIEGEAAKVAEKMLYEPRGIRAPVKIEEHVDHAKVAEVVAAKEMEG